MTGERTVPGLGLTAFYDVHTSGWKPGMDANIQKLSALCQCTVKSRVTTLPGSPTDGDEYIVPHGAGSHPDEIAIRDNGAWVYFTPTEGWLVWLQDENNFVYWNSSVWVLLSGALITNTPAGNLTSTDVQSALNELDTEKFATTGGTLSGGLAISVSGGSSSIITVIGEGNTNNMLTRISSGTTGPAYQGIFGSGTIISPGAPPINSTLIVLRGRAVYDSSMNSATAGDFRVDFIETGTPSVTAAGGRLRGFCCPIGSGTNTEIFRFDNATGFSLYGANVVISNNRAHRLRSGTLSSLNALTGSAAGDLYIASDAGGLNGALMFDGALLRRVSEAGTESRATDAAFTLTPISSAPNQFHSGTLTAARAVTLSTTGVYDGCQFLITRVGTGLFPLNIGTGPLVALYQNTWCIVKYDGANAVWKLQAFGRLSTSDPVQVAIGDESTTITTGTGKVTMRWVGAFNITGVRSNVNTVSSSGLVTVDVKKNGTTIFSTLLSIDASEKTSVTAATPAVLSTTFIADDDEITFDVTAAGTGAKGLKVSILGSRIG